jgi:hypothetical protein
MKTELRNQLHDEKEKEFRELRLWCSSSHGLRWPTIVERVK